MTIITDNVGNWFQIGTLQSTSQWGLYNEGAINGSLFRLTYITDWNLWDTFSGFYSFGLMRFYYRGAEGTFNIVDKSFTIYPKREQEIISLPIPEGLQNNTYVIRVPGIKYVKRNKPYPKATLVDNTPQITDVIPWSLKLEYLLTV